ncbi:hypothetical protein JCM21714_3654 [Gracilibacillus boraciitolerans JCM 21714]|uniref:Uncharacterized protein n=1 Tax=Gracilibacillus boraciitolerans JCM 21714 TaxID=1298598 RepID=W4VNT5_9BACI|nr:hypothetical protein JCM21714_3654 [Gracilibacillus boraciitolerans JCM 21714]
MISGESKATTDHSLTLFTSEFLKKYSNDKKLSLTELTRMEKFQPLFSLQKEGMQHKNRPPHVSSLLAIFFWAGACSFFKDFAKIFFVLIAYF